jgi:hypothetical protein
MVLYQICVFGADLKFNMAARAHNVFSLAEILKNLLVGNHQANLIVTVKTKSSHGGHPEFPIGKRFTSLVQDHPMIIPAKSQPMKKNA